MRGFPLLLLLGCVGAAAGHVPHMMGGITHQIEREIQERVNADQGELTYDGGLQRVSADADQSLSSVVDDDADADEAVVSQKGSGLIGGSPATIQSLEDAGLIGEEGAKEAEKEQEEEEYGAFALTPAEKAFRRKSEERATKMAPVPQPLFGGKVERASKKAAMAANAQMQDQQRKEMQENLINAIQDYHDAKTTQFEIKNKVQSIRIHMASKTTVHQRDKDKLLDTQFRLVDAMKTSTKDSTRVKDLNSTLHMFIHKSFDERQQKQSHFLNTEHVHPPSWVLEAKAGALHDDDANNHFDSAFKKELSLTNVRDDPKITRDIRLQQYVAVQSEVAELSQQVAQQEQLVHGMNLFDKNKDEFGKFEGAKQQLRKLIVERNKVVARQNKLQAFYHHAENNREDTIEKDLQHLSHNLNPEGLYGSPSKVPRWLQKLEYEAKESTRSEIAAAATRNTDIAAVESSKAETIAAEGRQYIKQLDAKAFGTSLRVVANDIKQRYMEHEKLAVEGEEDTHAGAQFGRGDVLGVGSWPSQTTAFDSQPLKAEGNKVYQKEIDNRMAVSLTPPPASKVKSALSPAENSGPRKLVPKNKPAYPSAPHGFSQSTPVHPSVKSAISFTRMVATAENAAKKVEQEAERDERREGFSVESTPGDTGFKLSSAPQVFQMKRSRDWNSNPKRSLEVQSLGEDDVTDIKLDT